MLLVDDNVQLIADAKSRHATGKNFGRGQHVGQWCCVIGKLVDIEEDGARNVLREVACAGINRWGDTDWRKRGIKDYSAGIAQTAG